MKSRLFFPFLLAALLLAGCSRHVPVYGWLSFPDDATAEDISSTFRELKDHGLDGVCVNYGFDVEKTAAAAREAKALGLEYHAWAPAMLQGGLDSSWYAVNRLGESAYTVQAYVPYYKALDPRNPHVVEWLVERTPSFLRPSSQCLATRARG